ncbi:MAG: hypothetical protein U0176_12690 [Bacteroidia bacterium]
MTQPTPSLHPSEDYEFLRQEGLAHIQRLSGKLWTDFNVHDPGVTMLEILAFAVADLGFRAGHPIADILAPDSEESAELKQFFTLAEIATTRPWSPTDYRKLLMDMPGVANAWVSKSRDQEVYIYLQSNPQRFETRTEPENLGPQIQINGLYELAIRFEQDPQYGDLNDNSIRFWKDLTYPSTTGPKTVFAEVEIELPCYRRIPQYLMDLLAEDVPSLEMSVAVGKLGDEKPGNWYCNVLVWQTGAPAPSNSDQYKQELRLEWRILQGHKDEDFKVDLLEEAVRTFDWRGFIQNTFIPRRDHVRNRLEEIRLAWLAHRNLCEDVYSVVPMDLQEIALDMDLQVKPGTNVAALEAEIYLAIQQHLDPPIRFQSLGEMLDKGRSTAEIFDGPLLKNGFLDPADWPKVNTHIYASDLIHIIMDLPDVVLVRNFSMSNRITGDTVVTDIRDALVLTEPGRFQPVMDARRSVIRYWDGRLPIQKPDDHLPTVLRSYRAGLMDRIRFKGIDTALDIPVPTGRNRNLDSYYSVREEFPEAWGIGSAGLPTAATAERINQAEQLKGYLLHFEQMLCLYLSQLRHVKHLLAVGAAPSLPTYMHRVALEVMGLEALQLNPGEYPSRLAEMVETEDSRIERRERLLDHLLARFQTSLAEAAALSWREGGVAAKDVWVRAKSAFLQAFPSLSANRAGAMDYSQRSENCSPYSGFQRRVMGLMGWEVPETFRLNWLEIDKRFSVQVLGDRGELLLESDPVMVDDFSPVEVMNGIIDAVVRGNVQLVDLPYLVQLTTTALVPARSPVLPSSEVQQQVRESLRTRMMQQLIASKFILVEHLLLRPREDSMPASELLRERLGEPHTFDVTDPWSCRVSFVFPDNSDLIEGTMHAGYRRLLQRTIREELPAHIIADFFWLDDQQWPDFDMAYEAWRKELYQRSRKKSPLPTVEVEALGEINAPPSEGKFMSMISNSTNLPRSLGSQMNYLRNRFGAICLPAEVKGKRYTEYKPYEVVVNVIDPDGEIVKAWPCSDTSDSQWLFNYENDLKPHDLGSGLELSKLNGKIQASLLGLNGSIPQKVVKFFTMNEAGGVTYHEVSIEIKGDAAPVFLLEHSKFDFEYHQGDLLGRVVDEDSVLISVKWNLEGTSPIPPYLALNEATGELRVGDIEAFQDYVASQSSDPVEISVAFLAENDLGVKTRVPLQGAHKVQVKINHPAIATPHPEMENAVPASFYFNENQYLYRISDHADGGIRFVTGRLTTNLASWGLTIELAPGSPRSVFLKISNLPHFLDAFANANPVPMPRGGFRVLIYLKAIDDEGNATNLNLYLIMGQEQQVAARFNAGAAWEPNMVRGKLSAYRKDLVIGYISDADGGIPTAPVIAEPMRSIWSRTGLAFQVTRDVLPRQALVVTDANKLGSFLESGQGTRDGGKTKVTIAFSVDILDSLGQPSTIPISFVVDNSAAIATKEAKLLQAAYVSDLRNGDLLYSIKDEGDRGIDALIHNSTDSVFADWGLQVVPVTGTYPQLGLGIVDEAKFKGKFNPATSLNQSLNLLEGKLSVLATDKLGLWSALTLDFYFNADRAAVYTPNFDLGDYNDFDTGFEIGRVTDFDRGVQSIAVAGTLVLTSTGMNFVPDPLRPTEYVLKVVDGPQFKRFFPTGFRYVSITNRYELRFDVTVTDPTGGSSLVGIQIKINGQINTKPTWRVTAGYDGSMAPTGMQPKQTILEIENDADGGIKTAVMSSGGIVLTDWGLALTVDTGTKRAILTAVTPSKFKERLELNPRLKVNAVWTLEMDITVTDSYGNSHALVIPVKLRVDTSATLKKETLTYLETLGDGTLLASVSDANDGGVVSFKMISANGYVPTDDALRLEIVGGVLNVKVGTPAKFHLMVRDYFTLNEALRYVSYSMTFETTDAYQGITSHTLALQIGYAKAPLQVTMAPPVQLTTLRTKSPLGALTFSLPYQFDRVENVGGPLLADLGISTYDKGAGRMDLIVGDTKVFNQAAYRGAMRLNLAGGYFSTALNLDVRFLNATAEQVPCTLTVGSSTMSSDAYYSDVPISLHVDVNEPKTWVSTTYQVQFDIRKYFPTPYGGLPDPPVLDPGSAATITVSSTSRYLFLINFAKAFFTDPVTKANGPIRLPYRLQYGSPTRRPAIDVQIFFHPKS